MEAGLHSAKPITVLVVDDDRAISKLIKRNLEDGNTQIVEAATGLDCIKIILETKVDLIIMDVRLPDFNGWGILSLLRLTEPLSDMPVILVSVELPKSALMKQLMPDDYIQKPFDINDLLGRIRKVVEPRASGKFFKEAVPERHQVTNEKTIK